MKIKIDKQEIKLILESSKNDSTSVQCCDRIKQYGVSCKKDNKGYFVATHRARSDSYETMAQIPLSKIKFVDSTG